MVWCQVYWVGFMRRVVPCVAGGAGVSVLQEQRRARVVLPRARAEGRARRRGLPRAARLRLSALRGPRGRSAYLQVLPTRHC